MPTSAPSDYASFVGALSGHDEDKMATGPTPLNPTPAGPTPLANERARRAPNAYTPFLDLLRPLRSALDRRSSQVLGLVAYPSMAGDLAVELFALANAHPELKQSAAIFMASRAHPRGPEEGVARLRGTLDRVKMELREHVDKMNYYNVTSHHDSHLKQTKASTPGEFLAPEVDSRCHA